jgi:hypothetical protein
LVWKLVWIDLEIGLDWFGIGLDFGLEIGLSLGWNWFCWDWFGIGLVGIGFVGIGLVLVWFGIGLVLVLVVINLVLDGIGQDPWISISLTSMVTVCSHMNLLWFLKTGR